MLTGSGLGRGPSGLRANRRPEIIIYLALGSSVVDAVIACPPGAGVPLVWVSSSDSDSGKARISPHPVTSLYNLSPGVAMTPVDDVLVLSEMGWTT